jgi:methyl-accepting chemotaxis protein
VTQIDHVTQTNAASAEETAAATAEMNGEVDAVHTGVAELRTLLGLAAASAPRATVPSSPAPSPESRRTPARNTATV